MAIRPEVGLHVSMPTMRTAASVFATSEAPRDELRRTGQKQTDSAVSLLSGVHRRDVRTLGRDAPTDAPPDEEPLSLASQVVARWLGDVDYLDEEGSPRDLPRYGDAPSFDSLVSEVSRDIRPRAVLAELERLGMAEHADRRVRLLAPGFVPRQGFAEMVALLRDNAHDHLAAATLNLDGQHNYLEQAVFVDELTAESASHLHAVAAKAWRQAFRTVMREAQQNNACTAPALEATFMQPIKMTNLFERLASRLSRLAAVSAITL
eukprot:gene5044-6438_t